MNIINLYEKYFDEETKQVLETFSNYKVYLIGGLVRDILLNKKSNDIDITFEGNAIELAKKINCEIISEHKDFGTVKIKIGNKNIDLASTRTETYPQKGHLPVINKIGCSLKEDIKRRDFTINALAMSLNKANFGEIIDYIDGLDDIKNKKIRILHPQSFIDDPSRILRGLKYSSRLGFSLDNETLATQENYLNNINYDMSCSRILSEFYRTKWNLDVFKMFINQNIYKLINPNAKQDFDFWFEPTEPFIYLALLLPDERFELTKRERNIAEEIKHIQQQKNQQNMSDFEIYKIYSALPIETVQILSIMRDKNAKKYLQKLKTIKIQTTGKDLINLGFKPSKEMKTILDFILEQKITNPNLSKQDEISLIKTTFLNRD